MEVVILVIHLLIAVALVGVVLLQRSEGGALGIGGNSAGGGVFSARDRNALTRMTAILAAAFMVTSIVLTIMAGATGENQSILDSVPSASGNTVPANDDALKPDPITNADPGNADQGNNVPLSQ